MIISLELFYTNLYSLLRMDKAFVAMQYFRKYCAGNDEYFMGQWDIIMLLYETKLYHINFKFVYLFSCTVISRELVIS